jgi:hypothetical protein
VRTVVLELLQQKIPDAATFGILHTSNKHKPLKENDYDTINNPTD